MKHINEYINEQLHNTNDVIINEGLWGALKFKIGQLFTWLSTKIKDMMKSEYNDSGNSLYHFSPNYINDNWSYWDDTEFNVKHIRIIQEFESQEKKTIRNLVSDATDDSENTCRYTHSLVSNDKFDTADNTSIFAFIYSVEIQGDKDDKNSVEIKNSTEEEKTDIYAAFAVFMPFVINDDTKNLEIISIEILNIKQLMLNKNSIKKRVFEIIEEYMKKKNNKITINKKEFEIKNIEMRKNNK